MVLTNNEIEFLRLCCEDLTYKEIVVKMGYSPRTIDGFRDDLFSKIKSHTRTGLIRFALLAGIADIEPVTRAESRAAKYFMEAQK